MKACQWTNGGTEVMILKCVGRDGKTHNGFKWPLTVGAPVESVEARQCKSCSAQLPPVEDGKVYRYRFCPKCRREYGRYFRSYPPRPGPSRFPSVQIYIAALLKDFLC